jgi:serine/threonine protein kinase
VSIRKLGNYEIVERLGRGGMAEVYRAYQVRLNRYVAIKVLHAFLADDPEFKSRFEKEAQNIGRLKHPNIVQVYDFVDESDSETYYMVMELIDGPTLKELIFKLNEQGELMPLPETLRIIREAASALAYAHSQKMIHRDVKPANLMLDSDRRVVLTDFGIAKIVTGVQFTASGGMVGTPAYMAPEQGLGEAGDERSDLYSLGVIFFQLVTGRLPYDGDSPLAVILKHLNEPIPSARALNPQISEEIDGVIRRLIAKNPDDRYQSAVELIADLERIERGEPIAAGSPLRLPDQEMPGDRPVLIQDTQPLKPIPDDRVSQGGRRGWLLMFGGGGLLLVLVAALLLGPALLGSIAEPTPTETPAPTLTFTPAISPTPRLPTDTPSPVPTPRSPETTLLEIAAPSETPTQTNTATASRTPTPSRTPTHTLTPSITPTETITLTPTFDVTLTLLQATMFMEMQTATIAACDFDFRIIDQTPPDGDYFLAGREYERRIVLLNTGTCPWERNTSLVFVEGESFNAAPPYFFIRERVNVGEEVTVVFRGRTPSTGGLRSGLWELRTPGQILIGREPIEISINVYEGG